MGKMSMLHLEKVNGKNIWNILKLTVSEKQKSFVAANDISIIEAYTAIIANGYAFLFGIYNRETPVGFLMISFDKDDIGTMPLKLQKEITIMLTDTYLYIIIVFVR